MSFPERMDMTLPPRGDTPYDAPSAHQLIAAVQSLISEELDGEISPTVKWKLRIASNALGIASREIQNIRKDRDALKKLLTGLQMSNEKELSDALREGKFDDQLEEILRKLVPFVQRKLMVANPSYLMNENSP